MPSKYYKFTIAVNVQDPASGAVRQPQASMTVQPRHKQTWAFSEALNYEQLSMWLSSQPQFVGADYEQDISKLKGNNTMSKSEVILLLCLLIDNRINGSALLSLDESTLGHFGVTYGFKHTLMNIIIDLVCVLVT